MASVHVEQMLEERLTATSSLSEWLRVLIGEQGPRSIDKFVADCLTHHRFGYYRQAHVIGAAGDFVTAPEISQVYGELIGIWCAAVWETMGRPCCVRLVELGPGRGTLMADALRALRVVPELLNTLRVELVEISGPLKAEQELRLADVPVTIIWCEDIAPFDGATIIVGNEFLDTIPVRQLVFHAGYWHERCVGLDSNGGLCFVNGAEVDWQSCPLVTPSTAVEGDILEVREWRGPDGALGDTLAGLLSDGPLAALFVDYGYEGPTKGDTLQAVRQHRHEPVFVNPGEADVTAHVDFTSFACQLAELGLGVDGPISQAQFLSALGLAVRAERLLGAAAPHQINGIEMGIGRLVAPHGMGGRFKAIGLRSPELAKLAALAPA